MQSMKIQEIIKSFTPLEILLLVVFILYLIIPIQMPPSIGQFMSSSLGILTIFVITVFLFIYTNPLLAVLYIFVAYELVRRSSQYIAIDSTPNIIKYNIHNDKTQEIVPLFKPEKNTLVASPTLEEEVVAKMAPVGQSDQPAYMASTYKPVSDKINHASLFM
jgi:hypothetical protein